MARTPKQRCADCSRFINGRTGDVCPDSKGLLAAAPKGCRFRAGPLYRPKFFDKPVKNIKFEPAEPAAWSFWFNATDCLMVTWTTDHNDYGVFDCYLLGVDDAGLMTKTYTARGEEAAFVGEVVVKGAAASDLWASFGYEDEDMVDAEGNVTNKPRSVQLRPRRKD